MRAENAITAIVVLYYSKHLVKKLLENISDKIPRLDEILLIDNSMQDLSEFDNSMVKTIHPPKNVGYGAAINLGVALAQNDYIIALNPDVLIDSFDESCMELLNQKVIISGKPIEWASVRCFPTITFDFLRFSLCNLARPLNWVRLISNKTHLKNLKSPVLVDWVSGALILTNKETLSQVGGFDEEYFLFYEEVDLCKRAELKGIPRYITPGIQFFLNQGTASSTDVSAIKMKAELFSAKKYHRQYSGKFPTYCMFFMLKKYSFCIWIICWFFNKFFKSDKISKKQTQYKIYYDFIFK